MTEKTHWCGWKVIGVGALLWAAYSGIKSCAHYEYTPKQAIISRDAQGKNMLEIITKDGSKFQLYESSHEKYLQGEK